MVAALDIRTDLSAGELRALARREKDPRAALRMYAIAHALEGKSRAEAARWAGMERQALHDAVVRYNAEGLAGLHDRPKGRRRPVLDEMEGVALKQLVLAGPDLARHGRTEWTLPSLAEEIAHLWGKSLHPASLSRVLRRLGLSKQTTRPRHPQAHAEAQEAFKGGLAEALAAAQEANPGQRIELWFEDEARVGQKGRTTHRWWTRGQRPPDLGDKRFASTYLLAAVEPATGAEVALVLPSASTAAMFHRRHEPLPGRTLRQPRSGRSCCARARPDRLARRARPGRARQHHLGAAAALQPRAQPRRAGLALPARAIPLASPPGRRRGRRRRLLRRLDRPDPGARAHPVPHQLPLAAMPEFISRAVLQAVLRSG